MGGVEKMIIQNYFGSCEYEFEPDYVHIFNLFVKPKFRLQGKARELLQIAIKQIRKIEHKEDILIENNLHKNRSIPRRH